MAENTPKTQSVPNIRQGNKRFNEQMNHAYWIDRNQARYIDKELLYNSSSWLLKREMPKPGDSKHADDKVNYWRLPPEHQNFPQYPNQNFSHHNSEGYNVKRTIHESESGISPGEMTSKRLKTHIIQQERPFSHDDNADIAVQTQRASAEKNEKQCELTHIYQGNYSQPLDSTKSANHICGSNSQEIHPQGSNESLQRNKYSYHANRNHLLSTKTLNKTSGKLEHFETPIHPNSSKLFGRLQDQNTSRVHQEDFRKAIAAGHPVHKEKSLIPFPVSEQDNVLTVAKNYFPIPHQNRFTSNLTHSELQNTVTPPVDAEPTREFNRQQSAQSDDALFTPTITEARLQENHIISPASESWIKFISKGTQMVYQEKQNFIIGPSKTIVAENMKKLDELRKGFRGMYTKIDFSKPGDLASNNPTNGIYPYEFSKNLQSATNKLNDHNKANENPSQSGIWLPETSTDRTYQNTTYRESEPESKSTHGNIEVERKIKKLLHKSLQSKISRKNRKLVNDTPKGTTREDGVLASTSNAPTQYETTINKSDKVANFSNKCPQRETNKHDSPEKCSNKTLEMSQMQIAKNKMQILQSLCKNNPVFLKCLSHQVLRKSHALQQKIKSLSEVTDLKTQQSPYITKDHISPASINNFVLEESTSNTIINQEAQRKADSSLSQPIERFSCHRSINFPQYQPQTNTNEYQPPISLTNTKEYQPEPSVINTTNDLQRFNPVDYQTMLNTANHQVMKNMATNQSKIKPMKPARNAYQDQLVADQTEYTQRTDRKNDELIGLENLTTDKYEQLKHFEQLLKVEYDRYIESKLKVLKTDMDKLENSTPSGQRPTDSEDYCDDVLVIDYFDVDSFIKMEAIG